MMDFDTIIRSLTSLGFTSSEAKVYLALLELNEALPSVIARKAGIKRPNTYLVLGKLENAGLASHVKKSGHLFFRASKPNQFLDQQFEKQKKTLEDLNLLKQTLPEIMNLNQDLKNTPQMSVFKGKEGLIEIMEDTLTTKGELLCWSNAELAVTTILSDYHPSYLKKKIQRKIKSKCLFTYDKTALSLKEKSKEQLREVRFIPKGVFNFENEINVYDDKMSIISHKDEIGVIIQNQAIADTQKAMFYFAFQEAKKK